MIKCLLFFLLAPAIKGSTLPGFESIRSEHFDFSNRDTLNSVHLTPGEMKLFSSHILHLVKNRCPTVNHHKLFKIQKYISKRLSLLNPTKPGNMEEMYMANVIESMKNCSSTFDHDHKMPTTTTTGDGLVHLHIIMLNPEPRKEGKLEQVHSTITKKVLEPFDAPPTPEFTKEATSVTTGGEKVFNVNTETLQRQQPAHIIGDAPLPPPLPTLPIEDGLEESDMIPIIQFHVDDWFSSMWQSITSFFHDAFTPPSFVHHRGRRFAQPDNPGMFWLTPGEQVHVQTHHEPSTTDRPKTPAEIATASPAVAVKRGDGKQAFADLFDQACGIYCDCPRPATLKFQTGVIQLLQFLFEDMKSLDTAAFHLIDDELLKEMKACIV